MSEGYLYAKSLHIVFVVTWFAALFYVVRLFVYQTEAHLKERDSELLKTQLKLMTYRLWYVIGWPSAVLALLFGLMMLSPWWHAEWMRIKLCCVLLLLLYHLYCHRLFLQLQKDVYPLSSFKLRILNEVPTLLLFLIVFLAVWKSIKGFWVGAIALLLLAAVIFIVIKLYRRSTQ